MNRLAFSLFCWFAPRPQSPLVFVWSIIHKLIWIFWYNIKSRTFHISFHLILFVILILLQVCYSNWLHHFTQIDCEFDILKKTIQQKLNDNTLRWPLIATLLTNELNDTVSNKWIENNVFFTDHQIWRNLLHYGIRNSTNTNRYQITI